MTKKQFENQLKQQAYAAVPDTLSDLLKTVSAENDRAVPLSDNGDEPHLVPVIPARRTVSRWLSLAACFVIVLIAVLIAGTREDTPLSRSESTTTRAANSTEVSTSDGAASGASGTTGSFANGTTDANDVTSTGSVSGGMSVTGSVFGTASGSAFHSEGRTVGTTTVSVTDKKTNGHTKHTDAIADGTTATTKPYVTETTNSGVTETAKPHVTKTTNSGVTETAKPHVTKTTKPGATYTTKPGATHTVKPGTTNTARPGTTQTVKPGTTNTVKPGTTHTQSEKTGEQTTVPTTKKVCSHQIIYKVPVVGNAKVPVLVGNAEIPQNVENCVQYGAANEQKKPSGPKATEPTEGPCEPAVSTKPVNFWSDFSVKEPEQEGECTFFVFYSVAKDNIRGATYEVYTEVKFTDGWKTTFRSVCEGNKVLFTEIWKTTDKCVCVEEQRYDPVREVLTVVHRNERGEKIFSCEKKVAKGSSAFAYMGVS